MAHKLSCFFLSFLLDGGRKIYKLGQDLSKADKTCHGCSTIMEGLVKKLIFPTVVCLVCLIVVGAMGGYAQAYAANRLVPVYRVARTDNKVAITFDAAWGADKTQQILDVCRQYNVTATFFLVEFWVQEYPHMVAQIAAEGHEIGTHSSTHPQMSKLSAQQITQQLQSSSKAIFGITGQPVTLFRPPFGDYNNTLIQVATDMGLHTIQWSVDSLDWRGLSALQIATRVQKATAGDIILCHNNSDHIVQALPLIFEALQLKGLQFVPVGQLIYTENYHIDSQGTMICD